nr:unnamed protein product [Digitaria exilis]
MAAQVWVWPRDGEDKGCGEGGNGGSIWNNGTCEIERIFTGEAIIDEPISCLITRDRQQQGKHKDEETQQQRKAGMMHIDRSN